MTVVLLDLDGTLVDSLPGIAAAYTATLGRPFGVDDARSYVGPPMHESYRAITGLEGDALDAIVARHRAAYREVMVEGTFVYDGIPELLERLGRAGRMLGVATSKSRPIARELLTGLDLAHHFAVIEGPVPPARDDKRRTIAAALRALSSPPVATVTMCGDRHHDIDGAHALGVRAIGVTWGFGSAAELRGADALAASPEQLGDLLLA